MTFIPDKPMFETPDDITPGMRRYNALRAKKKAEKASIDYSSKYSKPIKPNRLHKLGYIVTSVLVMYKVADNIAKEWGIVGSEVMLLGGIGHAQFSWSVVVNELFYFGGSRYNRNRIAHLIDLGYLIETTTSRGTKKVYLSNQGTILVRHFADTLADTLRRKGIE